MNMKVVLLFLLLSVTCAHTYGQFDGYIISDNDTTRGFIKPIINTKMGKECLFKTDDGDQFSTLSVEDIDGYGYDGRIFEKRNVNTTNFEEVLFLELVVKSIVSLYYTDFGLINNSTSTIKTGYFIEKDNQLHELFQTKGLKKLAEGNVVEYVTKNYIGTLSVLLNDCSEITKNLNSIGYGRRALSSIIKKYNKCNGFEISENKKSKSQKKNTIGIQAGYFSGSLNLTGTPEFQKNADFDNVWVPSVGIFFESFGNVFSVRTGLEFMQEDFEGSAILNSDTRNATFENQLEISASYIKIPVYLNYNVPVSKGNFLFFGAGLTGQIINGKENKRVLSTIDISTNTILNTSESEAIDAFRSFDYLFTARLGANLKLKTTSLSAAIRIERSGQGLADINSSNITRIGLVLGVGI